MMNSMCSTLTLVRRAGCALLLALASAAVFAEGADTASLRWFRDAKPRDVVPDFRYTRRADTVYVIVRHVAAPSFLLRAFRPTDAVKAVENLDTRRPARWQLTAEGLRVTPDVHPGRYPVYVLKVTLKGEG